MTDTTTADLLTRIAELETHNTELMAQMRALQLTNHNLLTKLDATTQINAEALTALANAQEDKADLALSGNLKTVQTTQATEQRNILAENAANMIQAVGLSQENTQSLQAQLAKLEEANNLLTQELGFMMIASQETLKANNKAHAETLARFKAHSQGGANKNPADTPTANAETKQKNEGPK